MKKSLVVLLIAVLAVSAAFAADPEVLHGTATVETTYDVKNGTLTYDVSATATGAFKWDILRTGNGAATADVNPHAEVAVSATVGKAGDDTLTPETDKTWDIFGKNSGFTFGSYDLTLKLDTFEIVADKWELDFIHPVAPANFVPKTEKKDDKTVWGTVKKQNYYDIDNAFFMKEAFKGAKTKGLTFTLNNWFDASIVGTDEVTSVEPFYFVINSKDSPVVNGFSGKVAASTLVSKKAEGTPVKYTYSAIFGLSGEGKYKTDETGFNATVDFDSRFDKENYAYEVLANANYGKIITANGYFGKNVDHIIWDREQKEGTNPAQYEYFNKYGEGEEDTIAYAEATLDLTDIVAINPILTLSTSSFLDSTAAATLAMSYKKIAKLVIEKEDVLDPAFEVLYEADQAKIFPFKHVGPSVLTAIYSYTGESEYGDLDADILFEDFFSDKIDFGFGVKNILTAKEQIVETSIAVHEKNVEVTLGYGNKKAANYATGTVEYEVTPEFTLGLAAGYGYDVNWAPTTTEPEHEAEFDEKITAKLTAEYNNAIGKVAAEVTFDEEDKVGITAIAESAELVKGATITLRYDSGELDPKTGAQVPAVWTDIADRAGKVTLSCTVEY